MEDIDQMVLVSRYWRFKIKKVLNLTLFPIKIAFEKAYCDYFDSINCKVNLTKIFTPKGPSDTNDKSKTKT